METLSLSRADRHTQAVVQLLKTLTDKQLIDVLQAVGATPTQTAGASRPGRPCLTCGLSYPLHMKRWADDHPFDRPASERAQTSDAEDAPDTSTPSEEVASASEPPLCTGCSSRGACTLHGCLEGGR